MILTPMQPPPQIVCYSSPCHHFPPRLPTICSSPSQMENEYSYNNLKSTFTLKSYFNPLDFLFVQFIFNFLYSVPSLPFSSRRECVLAHTSCLLGCAHLTSQEASEVGCWLLEPWKGAASTKWLREDQDGRAGSGLSHLNRDDRTDMWRGHPRRLLK